VSATDNSGSVRRPPRRTPAKPVKVPAGLAQPSAPTSDGAGVSASDFALVKKVAAQYKIDPYILIAIGQHETGWGTQGDGRNGNILGVGSYDSGSTYKYAGLQNQLVGAAKILQKNGVHTIADIAAGKLAPVNGQVKYASDPNWSASVVAQYNQIAGTKYTGTVSTAAGNSPSTGTISGSGDLPANATPQQVKNAVASQFGYLSAFLDDPEVGPILQKAAKEGWDTATLQGALFKTNFWQKHSANQRQFDAQTKLDPATQREQIQSTAADLQAQARKTGLTLTPAQYGQIATDSLKYGWNAQQTSNALLSEGKLDYSGKQGPSQIAAVMDGLRGTAKSYFVPVSDQALSGWAKQVVSGQISQGDFDAYVKTQAKSLFPGLSTAIDRGVTVDQYVDPYRQLAAQTLEIPPSNIDFTNPKFNKALFQKDPKTGDNTSMSLSDFGTYLRGLPEYAKTAKANDDVAQFGTQLLNTFGKIA
jgi:hypothetical protein